MGKKSKHRRNQKGKVKRKMHRRKMAQSLKKKVATKPQKLPKLPKLPKQPKATKIVIREMQKILLDFGDLKI